MFGRGVAVTKSDFATYTFALLALEGRGGAGRGLGGTVELHLTYDEEAGGDIGPRWLLDAGLTQARLRDRGGLLLRDRHTRTTAACIWKSTVTGKQAHAAMPDNGRRRA